MPAPRTPQDDTDRSLAAAAVATGLFERARTFHGRSDISLGEALAHHVAAHTFNAVDTTTTVRHYTLENVVLDADLLILFKDGHAIPETAYFDSPDAIRQLPKAAELTPVPDTEDLVLGYNNAHLGYQHWVTQCLPAIDWSLRTKRMRDVRLILPRMQPWQADFLVLLGYDRTPRLTLEPSLLYHVPRVTYSDFLNGTTSFGICLSTLETARRIAHSVPAFRSDDKILFIDEVSPYYGSIRNEGAMIDLLRRSGITIVERSRLRIDERINLFRGADAVIGPHGQGLADVVFCRPGTVLWEWMPRHHQNASFNRLAQASGLDYWGDLFETVAQPVKLGEWEIDLALVAKRLAELATRLSIRAAGETVLADCSELVADEFDDPDGVVPEAEDRYEAPPRPPTAMELLARNEPVTPAVTPTAQPETSTIGRIRGWLRRR